LFWLLHCRKMISMDKQKWLSWGNRLQILNLPYQQKVRKFTRYPPDDVRISVNLILTIISMALLTSELGLTLVYQKPIIIHLVKQQKNVISSPPHQLESMQETIQDTSTWWYEDQCWPYTVYHTHSLGSCRTWFHISLVETMKSNNCCFDRSLCM
jgi:hypothetical protein